MTYAAIYLSLISLLAVIITLHDKSAAQRHKWRVRESTLLLIAALGGWVCSHADYHAAHPPQDEAREVYGGAAGDYRAAVGGSRRALVAAMTYANVHPAIFLSRPNRFIAHALLGGDMITCHVKNTGRCKELLTPGATVYVQQVDNPLRKTQYDLIAVRKGQRLINMDSQAPNRVFFEHLQSGKYIESITCIKSEAKFGTSRFDFYVEAGERKIFIEVKGVTLEEDGVVLFPDAPTQRGVRHLRELAQCAAAGYEAHVVFVVQMNDVRYFTPNGRMHPAFGQALREAAAAGVKVAALDCVVEPDRLEIGGEIPIKL